MVTTLEAVGERVDLAVNLSTRSILELPGLVEDNLDSYQNRVFHKIYTLTPSEAPMDYDFPEAREYLAEKFKIPAEDLDKRRSLLAINEALGQGAILSPLRANREIQRHKGSQLTTLRETNTPEKCDFCPEHLRRRTPKDQFGRISSAHCDTAANPMPYYAHHGLVIPRDIHDPTQLTEEIMTDMIHTGVEWLQQMHRENPEANFPLMIANLLPRAGSSVFHPHLQVMLTERRADLRADYLRGKMAVYQYLNDYPYPDELAYCLRPLGLVQDMGSAHVISDLTPAKEKGMTVYTNDGNPLPNGDLSRAIFSILDWQRSDYGVTSLNMAIYMRPMELRSEEERRQWHNFFPYARTVDRGSEDAKTSDFGGMETFFIPVIGTNPLALAASYARNLRERIAA